MKEDEMKALETVSKELCRLKEKYQKKWIKNRDDMCYYYNAERGVVIKQKHFNLLKTEYRKHYDTGHRLAFSFL